MARATASGIERIFLLPKPTARSHEIPRSCRQMVLSGMPLRRPSEISRLIASASAMAAPPALPSVVKTSNGRPFSSSLIVT